MEQTNQIPIWFFIGAVLLVYGILILGIGIFHLVYPPAQQLSLSELHPDIWWGGLLLVMGLGYCIKYWPSRRRSASSMK